MFDINFMLDSSKINAFQLEFVNSLLLIKFILDFEILIAPVNAEQLLMLNNF